MKTKLIFAIAALFFAWSCNDCDNTRVPESASVETIGELQEAINKGVKNITLTTPLTEDATIRIPNSYAAGSEASIIVPANGKNVTVTEVSNMSRSLPAIVRLDTKNAQNVIINTPNLSVVYSGTANILDATTAITTLTVTKGSTIQTLIIRSGGLKLYGTANSIDNKATGNKMHLALGAGSDRGAAGDASIKEAYATSWVNGLILTEGKYPLNHNMNTTSTLNDANLQMWYLPIDKNGYEIIGDGDRDKIIVYGKEYFANGSWGSQNLITVFANNVTMENLTLKVKDESNKTVEILGQSFTIRNCAIVPNNEITPLDPAADGGSVYFSGSVSSVNKGLVDNCFFKKATLSVDGVLNGAIAMNNNTFEDANYYGKVISTRNWSGVAVENSTMTVTGDKNTFKNIPVFGASVTYPAIGIDYGTFTFTNTTMPTNGTYHKITGKGKFILNGTTHVAP